MEDLYLKALNEHSAGNIEQAEKIYRSILEKDPKNHEVLHLLAILLSQQQDFINALPLVEQALEVVSDSDSLHNTLASILQNLDQNEAALLHYQKSLQLNPNNPSTRNNLGNFYYRLGQIEDAKCQYQEAIKLRDNYVDAYYNLSLVLIKQGLEKEAIEYLKSVIGLDPSHIEAHNNLACLLQLQGKVDEAIHYYQSSLQLSDNNFLAHHNLGAIFASQQNFDQAATHFRKSLTLQPNHLEALHNLGSILLLQKKHADALPCFLKLAELAENFEAYYNLGVIYQELSRFEDAITYFNKALTINPHSFEIDINLGAIYLQRKDFVNAEQFYLKALELSPENEEVRYILSAIQQQGVELKAPVSYLKNLFDQYAPYFDEHLKCLEYKSPELLLDAVRSFVEKDLVVLDLGCGTGMAGVKFVDIAKTLIGIDVSEKMLEVAHAKGVYSELREGEIEELLPRFTETDLVIAVDTLVYFGELANIFSLVNRSLKINGLFAFTTEFVGSYPYQLQRSARFAHSLKYIQELSSRFGFIILKQEGITLRKHENDFIQGSLWVLQKEISI